MWGDEWRSRRKEFDWVVVPAPATDDTRYMIGAPELAAMKSGARLVNVARGSLIDQDALIAALVSASLAGAFLDVTMPEPLSKDHPLWSAPNILISIDRKSTRLHSSHSCASRMPSSA